MDKTISAVTRRQFMKYLGGLTVMQVTLAKRTYAQAQHSVTDARWAYGPSLQVPIQEIYPTVFNNEIYISGGFVPSPKGIFYGLSPTEQVAIYSPSKQTWRQGVDLPEPRHHLGMASTTRYLYGMGGFQGVKGNAWMIEDSVFRLSSTEGAWQRGPSLPRPMAESVYATYQNNIHVVGGKTPVRNQKANKDTNKHYVLIDDKYWTSAAPATLARNSAASATLGNKLYVFGGRTSGKGAKNLNYVESYDFMQDRWQACRPLPEALAGIAAATVSGKIFVSGGEAFGPKGHWKTGTAFSTVWCYDPATDQWTKAFNMPEARHGHGAVSIENTMYVIGGAAQVGPQKTQASLLMMHM